MAPQEGLEFARPPLVAGEPAPIRRGWTLEASTAGGLTAIRKDSFQKSSPTSAFKPFLANHCLGSCRVLLFICQFPRSAVSLGMQCEAIELIVVLGQAFVDVIRLADVCFPSRFGLQYINVKHEFTTP